MKKRIIVIILMVTVLSVIAIVAGSALEMKSNNKLYRLLDDNKTEEALILIEKMNKNDVNAYSVPLFFRRPMSIFTQGIYDIKLPLVAACEYGDYEIIESLLKKGTDPNKFLEGNYSPIEVVFVSEHSNRLEIAKLLIEYGADVNLCGSRIPALFLEAGSILWEVKDEELSNEIITFLLDNGAKTVNENDNYSILHYTVHCNSKLISENLINNYQLSIDKINENGQTPLMMGAKNNAMDTVKLLLEHGADKSIKDNNGKTAYDLAVENGNMDIAELLKP